MEKVGGLILAGETFSPHPVFVLALLKHLQGREERKGGGIWRGQSEEEEHGHSVEEMHCDDWWHTDELWIRKN